MPNLTVRVCRAAPAAALLSAAHVAFGAQRFHFFLQLLRQRRLLAAVGHPPRRRAQRPLRGPDVPA